MAWSSGSWPSPASVFAIWRWLSLVARLSSRSSPWSNATTGRRPFWPTLRDRTVRSSRILVSGASSGYCSWISFIVIPLRGVECLGHEAADGGQIVSQPATVGKRDPQQRLQLPVRVAPAAVAAGAPERDGGLGRGRQRVDVGQ